MKFAVNYSQPAADYLKSGDIQFDLFKLPAWESIVAQVSAQYPCYIHFPLVVGKGDGTVFDFDEKSLADWERIERLMKQTHTPLINLHLAPHTEDHPKLDPRDISPIAAERVTEWLIADVLSAVRRFGAEMIIAENDSGGFDVPDAALLPDVIHTVIEETGCGFLFDLSHARLAAETFGMDAHEYIASLPLHRLREMHITGIQTFDENWFNMLADKGMPESRFDLSKRLGRRMDHLPITDADWIEIQWALNEIHSGNWSEPWVVSCEYGGIGGGFFEATMDKAVIREQFPKLNAMVKKVSVTQ
jgi:uncharacterized protein